MFSAFALLVPVDRRDGVVGPPGAAAVALFGVRGIDGNGGGNFAASASNANAFYPHRLKGVALGMAGGIGNLGVPMMQIVGLVVIADASAIGSRFGCAACIWCC